MNDDKRNEELRRRKIENFRVQIPEDSFPRESGRSPREEPPAINSYSVWRKPPSGGCPYGGA
ncbi:MAG: hypothetical protein ACLS8R_02335 [Anaeromassilibacillus sp.]